MPITRGESVDGSAMILSIFDCMVRLLSLELFVGICEAISLGHSDRVSNPMPDTMSNALTIA
jgi:hypothetical protein